LISLKIRQRPYDLLPLAGLLLILISFLSLSQISALDIHLQDTYFVVAGAYIIRLLGIAALFIWTLYLMTNGMLYSKVLTWAHVIVTIVTLVLFASSLFIDDNYTNTTPRRYYDYTNWHSLDMYSTFMKVLVYAICVSLLGQVLFVINLIAGLFKRKTLQKQKSVT